MIEDTVLEKAKRILEEREKKKICIDAGICHICGEKLLIDQDFHSTEYKCPTHGTITVRRYSEPY